MTTLTPSIFKIIVEGQKRDHRALNQQCSLWLFISLYVLSCLSFLHCQGSPGPFKSLLSLIKQMSIEHFLDTKVGTRESKASFLPSRKFQPEGNGARQIGHYCARKQILQWGRMLCTKNRRQKLRSALDQMWSIRVKTGSKEAREQGGVALRTGIREAGEGGWHTSWHRDTFLTAKSCH